MLVRVLVSVLVRVRLRLRVHVRLRVRLRVRVHVRLRVHATHICTRRLPDGSVSSRASRPRFSSRGAPPPRRPRRARGGQGGWDGRPLASVWVAQAVEAARQQAERWDAQTAARLAAHQQETATRAAETRFTKTEAVTYFTPALY